MPLVRRPEDHLIRYQNPGFPPISQHQTHNPKIDFVSEAAYDKHQSRCETTRFELQIDQQTVPSAEKPERRSAERPPLLR